MCSLNSWLYYWQKLLRDNHNAICFETNTYSFPVNQTVKMTYSHQDHDFRHRESILPVLPLFWQNFCISFFYYDSIQESEHSLVQHPLKEQGHWPRWFLHVENWQNLINSFKKKFLITYTFLFHLSLKASRNADYFSSFKSIPGSALRKWLTLSHKTVKISETRSITRFLQKVMLLFLSCIMQANSKDFHTCYLGVSEQFYSQSQVGGRYSAVLTPLLHHW